MGGVGVGVGTHWAPGPPRRRRFGGRGRRGGPGVQLGPPPPHGHNTLSMLTFVGFLAPLTFYIVLVFDH